MKKLRISIVIILIVSSLIVANSIGYSIWDFYTPPVEENISGDIYSDEFVELTGITITNSKELKIGAIFFEEDEANTPLGDLQFTITFNRNNLPEEIKNDSFTLISYLSLSEKIYDDTNQEINVLSGSTLDTIKLNDSELENIDDVQITNGTIIASIPISSSDTEIVLDYIFKQKLVLDYGDFVKGKTFNLTLSYVKAGN